MSTQEIITTLIKSPSLFFNWLKENNLQSHEFPSKVFNFSQNSDLYEEISK